MAARMDWLRRTGALALVAAALQAAPAAATERARVTLSAPLVQVYVVDSAGHVASAADPGGVPGGTLAGSGPGPWVYSDSGFNTGLFFRTDPTVPTGLAVVVCYPLAVGDQGPVGYTITVTDPDPAVADPSAGSSEESSGTLSDADYVARFGAVTPGDFPPICSRTAAAHRPVANADWIEPGKSARVKVLRNDTDPDGDALKRARLVRGTRCGKLTLKNGVASFRAPNACPRRQVALYRVSDGTFTSTPGSIVVMPTVRVAKRKTETYPVSVGVLDASSGDAVKRGTAVVRSSPPGISCPGKCTARFARGAKVRLTAVGQTGRTFGAWRGGFCRRTRDVCELTVLAGRSVDATFTATASVPPPSRPGAAARLNEG